MFLGNTLSSASSGLSAIEQQIAVISQNVANASTPNYVQETVPLSSLSTAGGPAGVKTGPVQRSIDNQLQGNLFASVATEAGSNVVQTALSGIDQLAGTPGSGQDLGSLFGNLQDSFSTLANDPASGSQQADVVATAGAFANGVNSVGTALVQARQSAQNTLQSDVATANSTLQSLGQISNQIVAAQAAGQSTADLENTRDGYMQTLSQLTGAKYVKQADGDLEVIAGNSLVPLHAQNGPFSLATANFSGATTSASVPALQLDGSPISGLGGEMGANLTLRDKTIPGMQSQLDSFAQGVASSFQSQGLPLFTDPSGAVPSSPKAGFASTMEVSAAVQANPAMVRDGTGATVAAGDETLITKVLSNVFSSDASGLPEQATNLIAGYSQQAAQAQATATTNTSVRTGIQSRLSSETGVSVDSEMAQIVQLQAAYSANAKVVTAVESMWTQLLGAVT